jgi:hypothetical protein
MAGVRRKAHGVSRGEDGRPDEATRPGRYHGTPEDRKALREAVRARAEVLREAKRAGKHREFSPRHPKAWRERMEKLNASSE